MPWSDEQAHVLDPCALIIVAHIDKEWRDQKEQTFYCQFDCFRRLVNHDGLMYIMQSDFSTNGEVEDERKAESAHEQRASDGSRTSNE
jgi:hypothetical protein